MENKKKSPLKAILITIIITAIIFFSGLWVYHNILFPKSFKPTALNAKEQQILKHKIQRLQPKHSKQTEKQLEPEAYSENNAKRSIHFTERELNALLAKNTDLAQKLAIDLSDNLASAKILIPLDPDFPILGGKTLKITAGVELRYKQQRPVVILKGVSLWGAPIPNAWLGNLKNVDLIQEFATDQGFWKSFSEGVELLEIQNGKLHIILKE